MSFDNTQPYETVRLTVRLGRNGTKLHPAIAYKQNRRFYGLMLTCSCPGSSNGRVAPSIVCEGHERVNCGQPTK